MAPAFCTTRQWVLVGVLFLAVFHTVEVSPLPFPGRDKCLNKRPLDEYVQHYEPVHYDLDEFHVRHKRAAAYPSQETIDVKFHAHGRHFHILLVPDTTDLTSHAEFHIRHNGKIANETLEYNPNSFLTGYVLDDDKSFVSAWNDDGVISANIHCSDGSYYLKPARDHFTTSQAFHSVIYRSMDISPWPVSMLKNATLKAKLDGQSHCGVASGSTGKATPHDHDLVEEEFQWREKHFNKERPSASRQKRQANGRRSANFVCTLSLYADYHFFSLRAGGDIARAISIMRQHVNKAINIFSTTDFDSDGVPDGYLFKIARITVVTDTNTSPFTGSTSSYQTTGSDGNQESNVGQQLYLQVFSTIDGNENFCEAVAFTYLDFPEGILGLAYLPPNGICGSRTDLTTPISFRGRKFSRATFNTGFVTFINHGLRQNDGLTEIVFSHELGHNWGSEHDNQPGRSTCTPSDGNGNYLMFSRATDGTQQNNALFSDCSRESINSNVERVLRLTCFTNDASAFCGNGVVEEGEECDCGTFTCNDPCCNPFNTSSPATNCKVKANFSCSPNKGECCHANCSLKYSSDNETVPCGDTDSCQIQSFCSNTSAVCPVPGRNLNGTLCSPRGTENMDLNFRQACLNGFCSESACAAVGYQPCSCGPTSCQLCCRIDGECVNTHTRDITGNGVTLSKVYLSPGRACNNYNGQCTQRGTCEAVDLNSSLNDITDLFDKETFNAIAVWLKNNWLWVVVIVVGIIFLALAVHFTYKYKRNHSWEESKAAVRAKTMRIGKSMRGPSGKRRKTGGHNSGAYNSETCARRLAKMFPLVDNAAIIKTAEEVNDEEVAVIKLLDDGQRMCKW